MDGLPSATTYRVPTGKIDNNWSELEDDSGQNKPGFALGDLPSATTYHVPTMGNEDIENGVVGAMRQVLESIKRGERKGPLEMRWMSPCSSTERESDVDSEVGEGSSQDHIVSFIEAKEEMDRTLGGKAESRPNSARCEESDMVHQGDERSQPYERRSQSLRLPTISPPDETGDEMGGGAFEMSAMIEHE